jgi:MerR family transcriptional regulator, copper efflux regulator
MMTSIKLKIGALAERTGTTPPTIRYYEDIGLLPRPVRQGAGQRRYGHEDVRRLTFIRRCRDFGFSVDQVRKLVGLLDDRQRSCTEARDIGQGHLDAIRAKLVELHSLEQMIADFVHECDRLCAGGPGPDCVPLAQLTHAEPSRRVSRTGGSQVRPARAL